MVPKLFHEHSKTYPDQSTTHLCLQIQYDILILTQFPIDPVFFGLDWLRLWFWFWLDLEICLHTREVWHTNTRLVQALLCSLQLVVLELEFTDQVTDAEVDDAFPEQEP